jgi:hypothetical protein
MLGRMGMVVGFGVSVVLMVSALWGWQNADELVLRWRMAGESATWGVRCAAVGFAAASQVILLSVIGRWVYRRSVSDILRLCGVLVVMLAGVTAVALALAGR